MRKYSKHTSREALNDNAFSKWLKGQTNSVVKNATGGIQNALDTIKTPTVIVTVDNKTQYTILGACSILAGGLIVAALFKR